MLIYSAGLRVGEVVKLKPEDKESNRMLIYIKGSKGRKGDKKRGTGQKGKYGPEKIGLPRRLTQHIWLRIKSGF